MYLNHVGDVFQEHLGQMPLSGDQAVARGMLVHWGMCIGATLALEDPVFARAYRADVERAASRASGSSTNEAGLIFYQVARIIVERWRQEHGSHDPLDVPDNRPDP